MKIFRRNDRRARLDAAAGLRFDYCCGAECDEDCRRRAIADEVLRLSPRLGLRVG